MTMISPFQCQVVDLRNALNTDEELISFFSRQKMKKYIDLHLRYRGELDSTTSVNIDFAKKTSGISVQRKQSHRHSDRVGILMVGNKRPLSVRFSASSDE